MMTPEEIARTYAEAGAQFLDSVPLFKNWREEVDKDELDMENSFLCVLGQLAREHAEIENGHYFGAWDWLIESGFDIDVERMGFTESYSEDTILISFKDLQQAWLKVLQAKNNTA